MVFGPGSFPALPGPEGRKGLKAPCGTMWRDGAPPFMDSGF